MFFSPQDLGSDTTYRTVLRCSKTDESESDAEGNCEAEVQGHTSNPASLEVAAIADTDDDYLVDTLVNEQKFINFELRRLLFVFFFFCISFSIYNLCKLQFKKNLCRKGCCGWEKSCPRCL